MPSEYDALLETQPAQQKSEYDALLTSPQQEQPSAHPILSGIAAGVGRALNPIPLIQGALDISPKTGLQQVIQAGRVIGDVISGKSQEETLAREAPEVLQQRQALTGQFGTREAAAAWTGLGVQAGFLALPFVGKVRGKIPSLRETAFGKPEGLAAETAAESEVIKNASQKPSAERIPSAQVRPGVDEKAPLRQQGQAPEARQEVVSPEVAPVPQPEQASQQIRAAIDRMDFEEQHSGATDLATDLEKVKQLPSPLKKALDDFREAQVVDREQYGERSGLVSEHGDLLEAQARKWAYPEARVEKVTVPQVSTIDVSPIENAKSLDEAKSVGGKMIIEAKSDADIKSIQNALRKWQPVSEAGQAPSVSGQPKIIATAVQSGDTIVRGEGFEPHDSIAARVAVQRPSPTQETGKVEWRENPSVGPGGKKSFFTADTPEGKRSVVWDKYKQSWTVQGEQQLPSAENPRGRAPILAEVKSAEEGKKWVESQQAAPVPEGKTRPSGVAAALKENQKGFIIREPDGTERFTNDRGEAARIANAAGQVKPENAGTTELHSQQLAEPKSSVVRGQQISTGDDVHWMSGGTWDGKVQDIVKKPSGTHDITVKATNGEIFTLKDAEHYGINTGRSKFITSENKPSYQGWEQDYPDLAKPVSTGGEALAVAAQPKEVPPPETPEALGEALSEKPRLAGPSNRVLQERAARGEIPQAPESGHGILKEDLIAQANQRYSPERAQLAGQKALQGKTTLADEADVVLHEEKLTKAAADAERALKANPTDPTLQQAYQTARNAMTDWQHGPIAAIKTAWNRKGINLQGATDVDTGTLVGLQKLAWDSGKGDFTPQQRPIMDEAANRVTKAIAEEKTSILKANEQVQKVLKPSRYMDFNQLRESLEQTLKSITC